MNMISDEELMVQLCESTGAPGDTSWRAARARAPVRRRPCFRKAALFGRMVDACVGVPLSLFFCTHGNNFI